jgi:hypothetical protein
MEEERFLATANLRAIHAESPEADWVPSEDVVGEVTKDNPYANLSDKELFD